jgi:MFS family permease
LPLDKCGPYKKSSLSIQKNDNKKTFLLMLNCLFLIGIIISQLSITYPVYIQESFPQMGTRAVSILFILDTLLIVIFQAPLANSLKAFNKIFLVGVGAFLMGLGLFILNFSMLFYGAIISCLIWTTGEMIFIGMAQFSCYEAGAEKKKGHAMGLFQATSAAGRIIGPIIGGYIYYSVGGHVLWSLSMVIGIYCLLICLYFRKYDYVKVNAYASSGKRAIINTDLAPAVEQRSLYGA